MAEETQGQERTEEATPKRLQEAREKGQVPRSRELNTTIMLLVAGASLLTMGADLGAGLRALFERGLTLERAQILDPPAMRLALGTAAVDALTLIAPLLGVLAIAALVGPLSLGGVTFSTQAIAFKPEKLNPGKGLGRIFAWNGLMELIKTLAKFVLISVVAALLLWHSAGEILALGGEPLARALAHAARLLGWSLLSLSAVFVLIAGADVPFQLWQHARQLKMTRQEVKDEAKQTEGRPEVKSRARTLARELAQQRMMEAVPDADVVIVNPTHYAVALRFDHTMSAPRVVAKGADLVAQRIRDLAAAHGVMLFSAPPLARALHASTRLGQEIPAGLYRAVAEVLAYVYQLKTRAEHGQQAPVAPADLPVPDAFLDKER